MSSSRLKLMGRTDSPVVGPLDEPANSRTFQQLMANTYKPGFIDKTDSESFKMSVDYELAEISKALFQTSERESNIIIDTDEAKKVVDELKVEVDGNSASITVIKNVTVENGKAIAELTTTVESNWEETSAKITQTDKTVAELDRATAESIKELKAEIEGEGGGIGTLTEKLEVLADRVDGISTEWSITSDVNGKIAGVQLINGTNKKSEFNVLADVFKVSHDADAGITPFEIVDGKTKIKNAVVGHISSDNWDGDKAGWAISKDGSAVFNNVVVRGAVEADRGFLDNITIRENCVILGTAKIADAQVDTIQIAGEAVTIPVFKEIVFDPTSYPEFGKPEGDVDVGCLVDKIIYNAPGKVVFLCNGVVEGQGTTNFGVLMRVWRDGAIYSEKRIATTAGGGSTTSVPFITDFDLAFAGNYGFQLLVYDDWPNGAIKLKQISMTVLGVKR